MYFERNFDGGEPTDNWIWDWDLIKSHSKKENETVRDDIKRWLPKGTKIKETKFGDSKGFIFRAEGNNT